MRALLFLAGVATATAAFAQTATDTSVPTVDVPVLAHSVDKGQLVSAADFTVASKPAGEGRGVLTPNEAAGKEAVRALREGFPVRQYDLIRPQWVRRGEPVTITVRSGALTITTQGKALVSGAQGEAVRVVNLSTNRTLDALVDAPGKVRIAAP
jgi:flagella basal body P-ring formation protein FlgA